MEPEVCRQGWGGGVVPWTWSDPEELSVGLWSLGHRLTPVTCRAFWGLALP